MFILVTIKYTPSIKYTSIKYTSPAITAPNNKCRHTTPKGHPTQPSPSFLAWDSHRPATRHKPPSNFTHPTFTLPRRFNSSLSSYSLNKPNTLSPQAIILPDLTMTLDLQGLTAPRLTALQQAAAATNHQPARRAESKLSTITCQTGHQFPFPSLLLAI